MADGDGAEGASHKSSFVKDFRRRQGYGGQDGGQVDAKDSARPLTTPIRLPHFARDGQVRD